VPDLNGKIITGVGQGPGLTDRTLGETYGTEQVALTYASMPPHTHVAQAALGNDATHPATPTPGPTTYFGRLVGSGSAVYAVGTSGPAAMASQILAPQGSGLAHENRQPWLVMNYIVCWQGEFPQHP
jgi:microcystin-dependent protein